MNSPGRKITVWVAAAGLAGLGLTAGLFWKDVLTHYHCLRLREDPDLLAGMIEQTDGSAQRAAARKYVETPEGKRALRRAFARRMFVVAEESTHGAGREPVTVELVTERGSSYTALSARSLRLYLGMDRGPLERFAAFIDMLGTFSVTGDLSFEESLPEHPDLSLNLFAYRDPLEGGEERIGVRCDIARRSGR